MSVVQLLDDGGGGVVKGLLRALGAVRVDPLEAAAAPVGLQDFTGGGDLEEVDVPPRTCQMVCVRRVSNLKVLCL